MLFPQRNPLPNLKRPPKPLGGVAPPSQSQICQLSAIKADYWSPRPPPSSARCSEGARPSERSPRPSDAGGRHESEDGLGIRFGADPSDRRPIEIPRPSRPARRRVCQSGGMARNQRDRTSEGVPLRSSAPSVRVLGGQFVRGRRFPDSGNPLPRLSIGRGGRWGRELGERTRGDLPPESSPAVLRRFLQLIGVSADELLGNSGRGTRIPKPGPPRSSPLCFDRRSFDLPIVLAGGGNSSPRIPLFSRPPPWAASALPPIQKSGEPVVPRSPSAPGAD